ncbi:hypothetical protein J6590_063900 [Homalodisca vitripennis]|nr:hypothetical protein J6590_063900 [Homalodisca vitripennis]
MSGPCIRTRARSHTRIRLYNYTSAVTFRNHRSYLGLITPFRINQLRSAPVIVRHRKIDPVAKLDLDGAIISRGTQQSLTSKDHVVEETLKFEDHRLPPSRLLVVLKLFRGFSWTLRVLVDDTNLAVTCSLASRSAGIVSSHLDDLDTPLSPQDGPYQTSTDKSNS